MALSLGISVTSLCLARLLRGNVEWNDQPNHRANRRAVVDKHPSGQSVRSLASVLNSGNDNRIAAGVSDAKQPTFAGGCWNLHGRIGNVTASQVKRRIIKLVVACGGDYCNAALTKPPTVAKIGDLVSERNCLLTGAV